MNYEKYTDKELIELRNKAFNRYMEVKNHKGNDVMILFIYGFFAFIGMILWALDEAMIDYPLWGKIVNYMIVGSGAAAFFYARKIENSRKAQKEYCHEELVDIDTEYMKRKK